MENLRCLYRLGDSRNYIWPPDNRYILHWALSGRGSGRFSWYLVPIISHWHQLLSNPCVHTFYNSDRCWCDMWHYNTHFSKVACDSWHFCYRCISHDLEFWLLSWTWSDDLFLVFICCQSELAKTLLVLLDYNCLVCDSLSYGTHSASLCHGKEIWSQKRFWKWWVRERERVGREWLLS